MKNSVAKAGLQPSSQGREAADLITRLSLCAVSWLIHKILPAFGTQKWKMQSSVETKVERFRRTLSMKLKGPSRTTGMALTSATNIRLCGSKGHACFLCKLWHWGCQRENSMGKSWGTAAFSF